jgi:hypothetical protein
MGPLEAPDLLLPRFPPAIGCSISSGMGEPSSGTVPIFVAVSFAAKASAALTLPLHSVISPRTDSALLGR